MSLFPDPHAEAEEARFDHTTRHEMRLRRESRERAVLASLIVAVAALLAMASNRGRVAAAFQSAEAQASLPPAGPLPTAAEWAVLARYDAMDAGLASLEAPQSCAIIAGPREQPHDLGLCRIEIPRDPSDMDAVGRMNIVADTPGSTVEIVQAELYDILPDGRMVPVRGGLSYGGRPVEWAGLWPRSPWFPRGDAHLSLPPQLGVTYAVPTDQVLHLGSVHARMDAFIEMVFVAQVRTTGSARVQLGIDYRAVEGSPSVHEHALSDWFQGQACVRATPRTSAPNDCRVPRELPR